jgi:prefoldin subunit 5
MNKQKEIQQLLEGIEEEIKNLEKHKGEFSDYEERVTELQKESEELKKELSIDKL